MKISIAASQTAIPNGRFGINNPQSAIRNHMRLAYFTPLPPSKSGIADYNSELPPYLAKVAEISVFVAEADELRENRVRADFSVHGANDFDEIHARRPYDLCVYHLGNNPYHQYIPADIHNQMYQFDVVTDRLIHGLMRFDAEWRGDIINEPKRESITLR
jgi:hypothetical protein